MFSEFPVITTTVDLHILFELKKRAQLRATNFLPLNKLIFQNKWSGK